ncbi:MAG: M14 family zinc carboxypeptidase [Caldilineaceae bacterium]
MPRPLTQLITAILFSSILALSGSIGAQASSPAPASDSPAHAAAVQARAVEGTRSGEGMQARTPALRGTPDLVPLRNTIAEAVPIVRNQTAAICQAPQGTQQDGDSNSPLTGQAVTIRFRDQADVNRLAGRLDVWQVDHETHTLVAFVTPEEQAQLAAQGYSFKPAPKLQSAAIPNYACYRTVEETYDSLANIAQGSPNLAEWIDIGDSWRKIKTSGVEGYDLKVLKLTNRLIPGPKPRVFIMAAIHARELATAEVATRFAEELVARYHSDPDVTWLLDFNEVHILAQSNPDGRKKAEADAVNPDPYKENAYWRKNVNEDQCPAGRYGVDLNRNSSFKWGACEAGYCSSTDPCDLTYRGTASASEPETLAIETYIRSLFPDVRGPGDGDAAPADTQGVMISLHSYSSLVLYPWGWSAQPAPNQAGLRTLARKFGYFTGYEACQSGADDCLYMTDGTTDDFAYGELGVPSYTFELGYSFFEDCSYFESSILSQTIDALTYAVKVAVKPYQMPAGPDVVSLTAAPALAGPGQPVILRAELDDGRTLLGSKYGAEPIQAITAVTYTLDAPSWIAGESAGVAMLPGGIFDTPHEFATATIDTTGWANGRHTVFVQATDAAGNTGPATAVSFDIGLPVYFPYVANGAQSRVLGAGGRVKE